MNITIAAKDTTDRISLDVEFTWQEGNLYCVRFADGTIRKYPMCQIWYIQLNDRPAPKTK